MIVKLTLPLNFDQLPDSQKLFFNDFFKYEEQPVVAVKNAFVTYNGIVLNKWFYVNQCFYKPFTYKYKYWPYALKRKFFSIFSKWGRNHTQHINHPFPVGIIHQPYINYFHFTIESLTRWIILKNQHPDIKVLIPKELLKVKYIYDLVQLLKIDYIEINESHDLNVYQLKLPTIVRWAGNHDAQILAQLRNLVLKNIPGDINSESVKKIFIVRSGRRKIMNLDVLKKVLITFGIHFIDFDGVTVLEQIRLMKECNLLIGQHGAGLTNMLFLPSNATVIELHTNPEVNNNFFDDEYYKIASQLKLNYLAFFANKSSNKQNVFEEDVEIEVEGLCNLIKSVEIS